MVDKATTPLKSFYFLRHGETDWNKLQLYMGSKDIPLNQKGEKQAEDVGRILKQKNIKNILTSPLIRANKTAEIVNQTLKSNITIIDELRECSFGEFEGKHYGDHQMLVKWLEGAHFNGAEHVNDFETRVQKGFHKALELEGPILIVAHGAVYSMLRRFLAFPYIKPQNCTVIFHQLSISNQWSVYELKEE